MVANPSPELVGNIEGRAIEAYDLAGGDTRIRVMTLGAILVRLERPDRNGRHADIVLGYDDPADYLANRGNAGAVCGRHANRLDGASFELDGLRHALPANDPPHHLHGGPKGFGKRIWTAVPTPDRNAVRFEIDSPDGDQGYPGRVEAAVTYALSADGNLTIRMEARTDAPTLVNLVHHGYWNLGGHGSGSVLDQRLAVDAPAYLPVRPDKIPTGERSDVFGSPFDFREPTRIGEKIGEAWPDGGYDHNLCLADADGRLRRCARLSDPISGRALEIWSDQPGLQVYTANHFAAWPAIGKGGARYGKYAGIALETQTFPNAPNVPTFASPVLRPGEVYRHTMEVRFPTMTPEVGR